jgi:predicted alpha/beta-hydrolase family hydrolase
MTHPALEAIAAELGERGVATLRYQFPFMEQRSRRPDPPPLAHAAVRAAVDAAARLAPDLAVVAGGRSFGGRMTSQAQAGAPLPGVGGLVFLGFFPCTRLGGRRANVAITCSRSQSRCCSCKGRATHSPIYRSCTTCACDWAGEQP